MATLNMTITLQALVINYYIPLAKTFLCVAQLS
jgi:hypothetical protein